ncbi:MAG: Asr1405/Asl0597 family protein [Microcystaceae cyanobacterium]
MSSLKSPSSQIDLVEVTALTGSDRWTVYHRLQELGISCHCSFNQPLKVRLNHPLTGIQLWSVVKQTTAPRSVLLQWLHQCWCLSTDNR